MSMTFTKLFSSLPESTVWAESDPIRIVWITMLAMADHKGRVWASVPGLANRARVSIPHVEEAIKKFMGPDPYSRTKDFEGRRINEIDGGWILLNHAKYRSIRDEEAIKESKRKYINTRRIIERESKSISTVEQGRDNAEAYTEADTDIKKSRHDSIKSHRAHLSDDDFIKSLKENSAYRHVRIDDELGKMDAWLSTRPGKKKTRRFIVSWLNRIERPLETSKPRTYSDIPEHLRGDIKQDPNAVKRVKELISNLTKPKGGES